MILFVTQPNRVMASEINSSDKINNLEQKVAKGYSNKFCNGIGISRQGDNNTTHLFPPPVPVCPPHAKAIATGSTTVFVNGKGCGRVGDGISGCTSVAAGSPNVFAG